MIDQFLPGFRGLLGSQFRSSVDAGDGCGDLVDGDELGLCVTVTGS